jgi:hypothetical protein
MELSLDGEQEKIQEGLGKLPDCLKHNHHSPSGFDLFVYLLLSGSLLVDNRAP